MTSISGRVFVPVVGATVAAPVLVLARSAGINATRVKIRILCARTTRGRSAVLLEAITTTAENAPGIEAQRAVTRSQPWTCSK